MTRTCTILITLKLALGLHYLGALTNKWLVMYFAGSLALALVVGAAASYGGGEDYARD